MIDYKKVINQTKYDFLRTNNDLQNIAYLVVSGSRGYGTNIDTSDYDLRGFLIEDKKYLYGLESFEQFEELETDTVIFGAKKFIQLCMNANPNTIELLGVPDENIVIISETGKVIRENSHIFLSKRVSKSFGNYALAQLRRLSNALNRNEVDEKEKTKHILNSLNAQMNHFNSSYKEFNEGDIKVFLDNDDKISMSIHLDNYPLIDFLGIYSEMSNTIKTYNKLKHRNNKKTTAGLYKHSMHLIRLLITGTDILDGKGILTMRYKEKELLLDIRNGNYSFDDIFTMIDEYEHKFKIAERNTKLPDKPDFKAIEKLLFSFYEV